MTGEKNRFKTTEKLWDLDDKQLKTPKHDAMVLWLMDKENIAKYNLFEKSIMCETRVRIGEYKKLPYTLVGYDVDSEVPIMSSKTFIAGYADLIVKPIYTYKHKGKTHHTYLRYALIEVKPYIDSFGAVLRQIKSYKRFSHYDTYILFTLDSRFDTQFESQGVKVIHPPENITIEKMMEQYGL